MDDLYSYSSTLQLYILRYIKQKILFTLHVKTIVFHLTVIVLTLLSINFIDFKFNLLLNMQLVS